MKSSLIDTDELTPPSEGLTSSESTPSDPQEKFQAKRKRKAADKKQKKRHREQDKMKKKKDSFEEESDDDLDEGSHKRTLK